MELVNNTWRLRRLKAIVIMESILSHRARHRVLNVLSVAIAALLLVITLNYEFGDFSGTALRVMGFIIILCVLLIKFMLCELFFRSVRSDVTPELLTISKIIRRASGGDLVRSYILSGVGRFSMRRLAVTNKDLKGYLLERVNATQLISVDSILGENRADDWEHVLYEMQNKDTSFRKFLETRSITPEMLAGCFIWFCREEREERENEAWWSEAGLRKISPLGRGWSYGKTYRLDIYARDLADEALKLSHLYDDIGSFEEMKNIQSVLLKENDANVMVVGNLSGLSQHLLMHLALRVARGDIEQPLDKARVFMVSAPLFASLSRDRGGFESELSELLLEAERVGNVILAIDDMGSLLRSGKNATCDVSSILGEYLSNNKLRVVAICDPESFHTLIESNAALMGRFEKVGLRTASANEALAYVEEKALMLEKKNEIFFTFQALSTIVRAASQYFSGSDPDEKAIDLLDELSAICRKNKVEIVGSADVFDMIQAKTGIPMGEIEVGEKDKLLNLEKLLAGRVVGQADAVAAVSRALRRARIGVSNASKPMGSFLFMGPTGVGKTETAKALADIFFGGEAAMIRLDMSEYQTDDSIKRLIGSFDTGKSGVLANMLRDKPYGVLLLDEFEKAHKEVHQLFLQVLDEGFFSDAEGRRVSAKNLIIIATSNAASEIIFGRSSPVDVGKDLQRDEIVNHLVDKGIFKPELLNRFDSMVFFRPLSEDDVRTIAKMMLSKLAKRLRDKGLEFTPGEEVISAVMKYGYDVKFGARPMQRAIQDKIEDLIAQRIIAGTYSRGDTISLSAEDLV